jgi:hypothetical protein
MRQRSPTAGQALVERHDSADIETAPPPEFTMKMILLFASVLTLMITTGCLVAGGGRGGGRDHGHYEGRSEVVVGPPVVVVRPAEVIVR